VSRPDPFDDWLERELAELPRRRASADFLDRVLAAHDRRRGRGWMVAGWHRAALVSAALILALSLGLMARDRALQSARDLEASSLRAEYRALERELREIRSLAAREAPLLRVGAGEDLELVLDPIALLDPRVGTAGRREAGGDVAEAKLPTEIE
jgi:hypothetical protein